LLAGVTLNCSPGTSPGPAATGAKPESSSEPIVVRPTGEHEVVLTPVNDPPAPVRADAVPPTGAFRTTPPADSDQVIRVFMTDVVVVNGARFTPADSGDELKVEVEWGDGQRSNVNCGPCRVDHVYRPGRYELTATIHDRHLDDRGSVTETFTVFVQGPAEPPAGPTPLPPNCHTITKPNGACPTGATTYCVTDPVVSPTNPTHALTACNACYGAGSCSNFNVTCFGSPTTSFQASVNLSNLNAGFVYGLSSASGPAPGTTSNFLVASCPAGGQWAN
jgi:hypothetical protein